jgi:hypothetical protein
LRCAALGLFTAWHARCTGCAGRLALPCRRALKIRISHTENFFEIWERFSAFWQGLSIKGGGQGKLENAFHYLGGLAV